MRSNVISHLQDLCLSRPAVDAPVEMLAAWYERKAEVLKELSCPGDAAAALAHAERLRTENTVSSTVLPFPSSARSIDRAVA